MYEAVRLPSRALIEVSGADAEGFLNGLLTCSTLAMARGERRFGALLAPQGKIIAEMALERRPEGLLLDVAAEAAAPLLARLGMLKLRAAIALAPRPDLAVFAFAGAADPRSPHAPPRLYAPAGEAGPGDPARWEAARIAAILPEQGADFAAGEVFPADVNMDQLAGVDFRKGCFIGQEVVSRMKRRGTARRRTLRLDFPGAAPSRGTPVTAGEEAIGEISSAHGPSGLARLRIDRLAAARAAGAPILCGGEPPAIVEPAWLAAELAALAAG
jgi:hypothetical protein